MLDGETSTLDLGELSLDELPHALLQLRVDAVLADTERLSGDEASLLRGLCEPEGREAVSAYLKERAARRVQLLGDIDAAQVEALEGIAEGRAAARVRAVLQSETASLRLAVFGLSDLPPAIGQLQSLKVLDLSRNRLRKLPEAVGSLAALEKLDLGNNALTRLPAAIEHLSSLRKLELAGNPLQLPPLAVLRDIAVPERQRHDAPSRWPRTRCSGRRRPGSWRRGRRRP